MKRMCNLLLAGLLAVTAHAAQEPAAIPTSSRKPEEVVARVGKTEIKWREVDLASTSLMREYAMQGQPVPPARLEQLRYDVLEEMVTRELVLQQAIGKDSPDLDARVKEQVEHTKTQVGSDEELTKKLAEMGMTKEDYTKRVREGVMIQDAVRKVIDQKVKITDADAKKFYEENHARMVIPEQIRASHILIKVAQDASAEVKTQKMVQVKSALALVKGGQPFAEVAKKFSEDTESAVDGGDLNWIEKNRTVAEFETPLFALKVNEVSDIVASRYGYHIIKVTDRKPAGEMAYADAKPRIEAHLKDVQSQEAVKQYVKELRDKSKVEILLPAPAPLTMPMSPTRPGPQGSSDAKPESAPRP